MAQGGDSSKRWTLKWTRLLCRSLSASLNLTSRFLQIGLPLKKLIWGQFLAQNCLWMQGMARVRLLDLRLQIGAFCASRLSVLLWQVRWLYSSHSWFSVLPFGCSCVLADFKFAIFHGRDCYKDFESDVKDNWDEVACCHRKGGQRNAISTGPLYSRR